MGFKGPAALFQNLRYGVIARMIARLNRKYKITGSPEFRPTVVSADEKAVVVSISPHPDDDILAVGGALSGHVVAGGEVHSIILTDGACGTADASTEQTLVELRRNECEKAADAVNLTSISFWEEMDGHLKVTERLVSDLITVIRTHNPDYVYTPFPVDYHFDHIEATRLVVHALAELDEPPAIRCYESIIPLIPNKIIDISAVVDFKRRAVKCFESQNEVSDYSRTIVEGLNRHRSYGQMAGKGYGEAVFETDYSYLLELLDLLHG